MAKKFLRPNRPAYLNKYESYNNIVVNITVIRFLCCNYITIYPSKDLSIFTNKKNSSLKICVMTNFKDLNIVLFESY
jgi:hypothetical protein